MIPNRRSRFCCRIFKTGVMVSKLNHNHPYLLWMGMRNDESLTRKAYEDVWVNKAEWGNDTCWKGILPIRKWTELDVWLYTVWKKIPVNPKYKKGYSRVGCHVRVLTILNPHGFWINTGIQMDISDGEKF